MEHDKISRLFNDLIISKWVTRKWIDVNDFSNSQYSVNNNIRLKNSNPKIKNQQLIYKQDRRSWFCYAYV